MSKRILVIDDEEWIGDLLQDFLTDEGYEVQIGMSIKDAEDHLFRGILPDALVLDVMLPDGNGVDFLGQLRSRPDTRFLPVIIISAHRIQVQDKIRGFEKGADDYLIKPFDLKEFKFRIEGLLRRAEAINRVGRGNGKTGEELDHSNKMDSNPPDPARSDARESLLVRIKNFFRDLYHH